MDGQMIQSLPLHYYVKSEYKLELLIIIIFSDCEMEDPYEEPECEPDVEAYASER